MYYYKWKPSKAKAKEFAQTMDEVAQFCNTHGIEHSRNFDSFYFEINGVKYRVSNHSVEASNAKAFNEYGEQVRPEYHENGREAGTVYIHASKTRIIEVYNDLKAGYRLDGRGNKI